MDYLKIIRRPVFAVMSAVAIVFLGIVSLLNLPMEQYPTIAPPTVMVSTMYPGASAEAIQKSVIAPLEQSINGVENMTYMTSMAANNGMVEIMVYFRQGTDPDMAAVNVQNRVAKATSLLPTEVIQYGVSTIKRQPSMLQIFSVYSPGGVYDEEFVANYTKINLQPELLRIKGVGDIVSYGADYSMRLWLKPDVMAQYGLVPADINGVLAEQNIEAATGSLGENSDQPFKYTMKYSGRLDRVEEFENMVIASTPSGEVLRLKDVATVELGSLNYEFSETLNGYPGTTCMVFQTAGSNAVEIIGEVNAFLEKAKRDMPEGLDIQVMFSTNDFLFASIQNVIWTLIIAIILVTLVVFFFLQDYRATLIPVLSTLVSVVGTFAFISIMGWSINLLTLFALVLVIGTVVDNSIVIVEAVQSKFDMGYKSAMLATRDGMKDVTSAVLSCTLVFMAVFIPVSFMSGTTGTFYTQFGITMAVSVGISALNSLTMCPALCAILMRPVESEEGKTTMLDRVRKAYAVSYGATLKRYVGGVKWFIEHKVVTAVLVVVSFVALFYLMKTTPTGLVPDEDLGTMFVDVAAAPGSSLEQTEQVLHQVEAILKATPEVTNYSMTGGYSMISGVGTSYGMFVVKFKPWSERTDAASHSSAIIGRFMGAVQSIKNAKIFAFAPPMITGYGNSNGFELHVQDKTGGDIKNLEQITGRFIGALNARPEIAMAYSTFSSNYPQYRVDVDAAKCKRAGVSPREVLSTIGGYYGGVYASQFNRFTKVYYVVTQAAPEYREDRASLENIYLRTPQGMAPVSEFATLTKEYGTETLSRFNLYNSILVSGAAAPGYSSGDAIEAIAEVAESALPRGYGYEFSGMTREQAQSSDNTVFIFVVILVLVYIILASLYESIFIPFAVLLSVPFGLAGSFLFAQLFGLENNIYLQTGLIMLIGLLAKTAILITQYASEGRRCGMSIEEAAFTAAKERLRPILMTALTMVFGMLPMMFASGVGANGNRSLGTGAVGGMLVGTLALLFIVPVLFVVCQHIQEYFKTPELKRPDEARRAEIKDLRENR
ncbi:MAG: efflux RND transporter permease subunit [Alistipes sp.]|nr:efflux RND transporter permease subunit [Alistipes sp.]